MWKSRSWSVLERTCVQAGKKDLCLQAVGPIRVSEGRSGLRGMVLVEV